MKISKPNKSLNMSPSDTIPHYVSLLADRTKEQQAIDALVQIGTLAIPALIVAMHERDRWFAAATALAHIGQPAIAPLIDLIQEAPFGNFAFHALSAMGEVAIPDLITALSHPHDEVRMWAATAFTFLPDARARDALLAALSDPDSLVRESAAQALGRLGDRSVEPTLQAIQQHDPEPSVRRAATEACILLAQS